MIRLYGHKFKARRTEIDGVKFASKKESRYYQDLLLRQKVGEVIFFLMQTPFHLPGRIKYLVDFVEFLSDGSVRFIDIKGYDTPLSKTKRRMVEELYPIKIDVL